MHLYCKSVCVHGILYASTVFMFVCLCISHLGEIHLLTPFYFSARAPLLPGMRVMEHKASADLLSDKPDKPDRRMGGGREGGGARKPGS